MLGTCVCVCVKVYVYLKHGWRFSPHTLACFLTHESTLNDRHVHIKYRVNRHYFDTDLPSNVQDHRPHHTDDTDHNFNFFQFFSSLLKPSVCRWFEPTTSCSVVKRSATELHRTDEKGDYDFLSGAAQPGVVARQTCPYQVSILDGWWGGWATATIQHLLMKQY